MKKQCCADCRCEFKEWETVYRWEKGYICENCLENRIWALNAREIAERMGMPSGTAEDVF